MEGPFRFTRRQWATSATTAIAAMSETQRKDPTWVYWRARALLNRAQTEADRAEASHFLGALPVPVVSMSNWRSKNWGIA